MNFAEWLNLSERKTADDIRWPNDCDGEVIKRKAQGDVCYVEPGGNHDKIRNRFSGETVSVIPRHRRINPYTCRQIISKVKAGCFPV